MISIALILTSIYLIIFGNMPLLGGKRARGNYVRIGGAIMMALSILTMFTSGNASLILLLLIFGMLAAVYFFVKGDEPTEEEKKFYGFKSAKGELKTYGDAAKGMAVFLVVLGVLFGGVIVLVRLIM